MTRYLFPFLTFIVVIVSTCLPVQAAGIDPYIVKYLHVTEPVTLDINGQGETRAFSPQEISSGKKLFETNCLNCHVGGATLPNPQVSLGLSTLKGANPPRDNINSLVTFLRQPMLYDGSEETFWCRQVPESLLSQQQVENIAAFVLTAAQKAPGWGAESF